MVAQAMLPLASCVGVETAQQVAFSLAGSRPQQRFSWLAFGISLHLVLVGLWCQLLTILPLGVALPLSGASYLTVTFVSQALLKERVNQQRWIGVASIAIGFALISSR